MKSGAMVALLALALSFASPARADGIRLDGTPLVTSRGDAIAFDDALFDQDSTIVSFTFTGCRGVCPTADLTMEALGERLRRDGQGVALLTFTLDPMSDGPEVLEARRVEIGGTANRTWITGRPDHVGRVLDSLGMRAFDPEDHPAFFLAVGRGGTPVRRILDSEADLETLLAGAQAVSGK